MEVHINQIEKRSWVEVDMAQLKNNYLIYKKSLGTDADVMAVIKADAYGHGDVQVARLLSQCGVHLFAVSNIDEAVGLREAGIEGEILILGYSAVSYAKTLLTYDLTQAVVSEEYAKALSNEKIKIKCQFAIDTGMNRIGLDGDNIEECEHIIREYSNLLNVNGIFTHLCVADTDTDECNHFTTCQISKFKAVAERILDLNLPYMHCCNSAGGLFYLKNDDMFANIGKVVRLGIVLYGLKPDERNVLPDGIEPALEWKSQISIVKDVHQGETIGYGRTFKVTKESRIATVTTGYADGFNRLLSNKGFVMINGYKAPIVGRVCMDQTMVDVTGIPDVKMGTRVTLIGKSGNLHYTADDMARDIGTIGYEVLCNISKRVQRFFVSSGLIFERSEHISIEKLTPEEVLRILRGFDACFTPRYSEMISDIEGYSIKLSEHANFMISTIDDRISGVIAFYKNQAEKQLYVPYVCLLSDYEYQGMAACMFDALKQAYSNEFDSIALEVRCNNKPAYSFYLKYGFDIVENRGLKYLLKLPLH